MGAVGCPVPPVGAPPRPEPKVYAARFGDDRAALRDVGMLAASKLLPRCKRLEARFLTVTKR